MAEGEDKWPAGYWWTTASNETKGSKAIWAKQCSSWVCSVPERWIPPSVYRGSSPCCDKHSQQIQPERSFSNVEQLLFKACGGQCVNKEVDLVCNYFCDDFNKDDMVAELSIVMIHATSQTVLGFGHQVASCPGNFPPPQRAWAWG